MKSMFTTLVLAIILLAIGGYFFLIQNKKLILIPNQNNSAPNNSQNTNNNPEDIDIPQQSVIAQGLDTPWAITFLPDGSMLVTERPGRVRLIDSNGNLLSAPIATITNSKEIGEGGLLGIALHPNFSTNNFVYLYYTYSNNGNNTLNRVVRMTYANNRLENEQIIVDKIPGASNHNGGRIKFGPDTMLYIGTGDAQEPSQSQNTNTLGGKILRVTDNGTSAPGNSFGNEVYSLGHRNVQGITWDQNGTLWATEHGRSGIQSGLDELNLIQVGKNYGWPEIQGDEARTGMETPKKNSGTNDTWAPGGIAYVNNSLYFVGLRGKALYEATIENNEVTNLQTHFKNELGRIRDIVVGPDNMLYITTSNLDGRGIPNSGDDKIIRINPSKL